ncbi:MAG: PilZ domain-containing protein [Candidatus Dactylopiibacterium carminicum]|uniref:PilZ domain-containing protein n=1 Tax=Candidatus Dactylopiibacterium carminicum TaxID=857335 RepID=A0A272EMN4_9RHOO|nr:PilZ domain-containing protein [Candidatus Dactylopiibacterium carminicum]KAF7597758.1 PilZ domain-containing protein [Candidatus Dactylopiibacterium carminicum]PAS91365.1 MAG: PilZ domain-containing protein [Candidatus Dactylopiibacterium carminicum]PAS92342.1 MAG: PilZ domain-containing protein [Candidatus Dactylopiibacterium carminicum]PAS95245.1 MAG: hypothetical protein BSR46_17065 [Candidatus Dactylopiibacterium carminicum]
MSTQDEYQERRKHQRFAAQRDGKPCIDILVAGKRITLNDLSIDGFSLPPDEALVEGETFDFEMRLIDGFGDRIRGQAIAVNEVNGLIGCQFVDLDPAQQRVLEEWLIVIVICGASVRLTPADAEAIVKGPSLI